MTTKEHKNLVFAILAVLISTTVGLAAAEIALRALEVSETSVVRNMYRENPNGTGSCRLRPNVSLSLDVEGERVQIRTNSSALHWREVPFEKDKQKYRIAFVGDSFTFGQWASSYETSLVGVAQSETAPMIELLNFGVPGYSFPDMELMIKEEVIRYDPDGVVIMVYTNDFSRTYLYGHEVPLRGCFTSRDDYAVERIPSMYLPPKLRNNDWNTRRWLHERFAIYRRLVRSRHPEDADFGSALFQDSLQTSQSFLNNRFWSTIPFPEIARDAMQFNLEFLDRIRTFLSSRDIRLMISYIPNRHQIYSRSLHGATFDVRLPQRYLIAYAERHEIPYLDLTHPLRQYVMDNTQTIHYRTDNHFTNLGHRVAGEIIAAWIEDQLVAVRPVGEGEGEPQSRNDVAN